jgi:orotate phosphoribosyltransferase
VEEAGGKVLGVLAVVDREQGGRRALEADGRRVLTLTTVSELGLGKLP